MTSSARRQPFCTKVEESSPVILKYGVDGCPPVSTMREWGTKLLVVGCIKPMGRPPKLTPTEDAALKQFFAEYGRKVLAQLTKELLLWRMNQSPKFVRN